MNRYAKSQDQKDAKRTVLLNEVQRQYEQKGFDAIKVDDVAKNCQVSKGTVFNYFESKETLFLNLLIREYGLWFESLEKLLDGADPMTETELARLLNRYVDSTLAEQPRLFSLLALGHSRLEHNVSLQTAEQFRQFINERGTSIGYLMAKKCEQITTISGIKLMMTLHTLFVGHAQVAELPNILNEALEMEEMEQYEIDLRITLLESLKVYMKGIFG